METEGWQAALEVAASSFPIRQRSGVKRAAERCPWGAAHAATCPGLGLACPAGSCLRRAAWSPEERAAFDLEDRRSEAAELFDPSASLRSLLLDRADHLEPSYRKRAPARVGERLGRFVVLGVAYRRRGSGKPLRCWRVVCDCGQEVLVPTSDFGRAGRRDGLECGTCTRRRRGAARALVVGGRTVAELSQLAGVSEQAIHQRIRLGWSAERLLAPGRRLARAA